MDLLELEAAAGTTCIDTSIELFGFFEWCISIQISIVWKRLGIQVLEMKAEFSVFLCPIKTFLVFSALRFI